MVKARVCKECGATETPKWRCANQLCNKCGLIEELFQKWAGGGGKPVAVIKKRPIVTAPAIAPPPKRITTSLVVATATPGVVANRYPEGTIVEVDFGADGWFKGTVIRVRMPHGSARPAFHSVSFEDGEFLDDVRPSEMRSVQNPNQPHPRSGKAGRAGTSDAAASTRDAGRQKDQRTKKVERQQGRKAVTAAAEEDEEDEEDEEEEEAAGAEEEAAEEEEEAADPTGAPPAAKSANGSKAQVVPSLVCTDCGTTTTPKWRWLGECACRRFNLLCRAVHCCAVPRRAAPRRAAPRVVLCGAVRCV